jgi:Zn-dependent oligopeptidase
LHDVRDAQSGELLGRFYLDLYARGGKPERPGVFVLRPGRDAAGGRVAPASVLLASFPSSRGAVEDLDAFYHELGHSLGVMLSRSRYARFSGSGLSGDGAEAPALLLGRLAWRPETAAVVFGPGDTARLLDEALEAREASWPWRALDDAALALADLGLHDGAVLDPGKVYRRAWERWALSPATQGTHPEASAAALVRDPGGASGRVLGALLSEEIWRRWVEEGLFNPASGQHLRETLFAAPAAELGQSLRNYLGREPSWDVEPGPEAWPVVPGEGAQGPAWRRRVLY